jgi:2-oxoglutarate ferredoxin oxidoreductase subunit alpha
MEFRIGGLEKAPTSNISYDPDNHQAMTDLRHAKVRKVADTIPTPVVEGPDSGELLVLGWGSTVGILKQACDTLREEGVAVSRIHLTHVWPLPNGLDEIFAKFDRILVAEMNVEQMTVLLRGELPKHDYVPYNKVTGQPFLIAEVIERVKTVLAETKKAPNQAGA